MFSKTAIIIGAGPAGLTATLELIEKTDIKPIVFEMTNDIGGISKTVNYKGNRIDIGGHRFFSKSPRVMQWWLRFFPLQGSPALDDIVLGRKVHLANEPEAPDPQKVDRVMLSRQRVSRIFFERRFYGYPLSLNRTTISNLGAQRILKIALSYAKASLTRSRRQESNLEDFFVGRFGIELYITFFKYYTEKVWGIPCDQISAQWGEQRVKGLSVSKAVWDAVKRIWSKDTSITQNGTESTLIKRFMYPKLGPGQLWEYIAQVVGEKGGEVRLGHKVVGLKCQENRITHVQVIDESSGRTSTIEADYVISTMPVKELIRALGHAVPNEISAIAQGLIYRDFITLGLLVEKLAIKNETDIKTMHNIIPDNWIYIQDRDVKLGRLQIFNNWSPYMVKDLSKVWMGLEYFCNEGDHLWGKSDREFTRFGLNELMKIGFIEKKADVLDSIVVRVRKAYPVYHGTYKSFDTVRQFVDRIPNLFLVGRNGMHRYNNQDHSMLTAMTAVENICKGTAEKENIWLVNTERQYHEGK